MLLDPSRSASGPGSGPTQLQPPPPLPAEVEQRFNCDDSGEQALRRPIRRLSAAEIRGSIGRVFGDAVLDDASTALASLPAQGAALFDSSFDQSESVETTESLQRLSSAVAQAVSARGLEAYHDCPPGPLDRGCLGQAVARMGLQLFRRPLEESEVSHYVDAAVASDSPETVAIAAMLMSPWFLFHVEDGGAGGTTAALNQFEVAARLAFMIEDATPDAELLEHARAGTLEGPVLNAQVERLLQSPRGRAKVIAFFHRWLRLVELPVIDADPRFLGDLDASAFAEEATNELDRFIEYVVYERRGDFAELLLSNSAFPHSQQLAEVFATEVWSEGEPPVELDQARGLLLRPPTMISGRTDTSPIMRGVLFLTEALCEPIPFPGDDVVDAREDEAPATTPRTVRQRTADLTAPGECSACHERINPVGFALERIDSVGRYRTQERVYGDEGVIATFDVDSRVDNLLIDDEAISVDGPEDLVRSLAISPKVGACFARRYFRFSQYRGETDNADECHMERMVGALYEDGDGSILGLLHAAYTESIVSNRRIP